MNLLNKLTIKNLKLNKKRTIVTIIGIILSMAMISAVIGMVSSFKHSLIVYEKTTRGNFHYKFENVMENDLVYFDNNRNIENYYLSQDIGYAKLENSQNENKPYAFLLGMDNLALKNLSVNLLEGEYPQNDTEVIIPRHLKTNGRINYKVGDKITLSVGKRMLDGDILNQNNPYNTDSNEKLDIMFTKEYTIVGIMERPGYGVEGYTAPGYTFITNIENSNINSNYTLYAYYNKSGLKNHIEVTADIIGMDRNLALKTKLGNNVIDEKEYFKAMENLKYYFNSNDTLIKLETNAREESIMQALYVVAIVVLVIIIVASIFCIKNSFDISITEKIRQYGMLSSVGATKKQIRKNVFYEAMILGIIGIPLGIFFGTLAAFILIKISNVLLSNELLVLYFKTSIIGIILSIVLGIITLYFSARKSAKKASKITPIQAIRNSGEIKINKKKIKSPRIIKKLFGVGGEVSYKNLKRNKKKYRTTVVSIIVCVSVFIGLYSFVNLAYRTIKLEYGEFNYNIYVSMNNSKNTLNYANMIKDLDSVKDYSILLNYGFNIINPNYTDDYKESIGYEKGETGYASVVSLGEKEYKKYLEELNLDYSDTLNKAIIINNYMYYKCDEDNKCRNIEMEITNYQPGDILKGNLDHDNKSQEIEIEVAKLTTKRPLGLENNFYNSYIIVSDEFLHNIIKNDNIIYVEMPIYSSDSDKLQDDIEKLFKEENYEEYHINNVDKSMQEMKSIYTLMAIFLYGFITVIALIGITNIFNTITTNMNLRRSEFATLKSVGMTKSEFNRMIRLESFFYGMKSLLIGIPIGIMLSYLIYRILITSNIEMTYEFPIGGIVISIVAVFLLIYVIMHYSVKKISKQNIIETIRNENI